MLRKISLLLLTCISVTGPPWPQDVAATRKPAALVGTDPIYEEELSRLLGGQLQQLRTQEYQLKKQALEDAINQKLVAAETAKKGPMRQERYSI